MVSIFEEFGFGYFVSTYMCGYRLKIGGRWYTAAHISVAAQWKVFFVIYFLKIVQSNECVLVPEDVYADRMFIRRIYVVGLEIYI